MEIREAEEEADLHIDHEDGAPPVDTAVPIVGGERESVEAFLLRLGLKDLGGWRFETIPDKKRVGKVNYIASNLQGDMPNPPGLLALRESAHGRR